jgi:hypothetical protein
MSREFVHALNEEIRSISGYYMFIQEGTIDYDGKKILYLLGEGQADSACCGRGGCRYVLVPGSIVSWKSSEDKEGRPISQIDPLEDPVIKENVQRQIREIEGISQVQFW